MPVIQNVFDPYQSCVIAPSHVLYGLTKNIIDANIRHCTPAQRTEVDKLIFRVLSSCGMTSDHNIINFEAIRLNNMTISNTFAVLSGAPWAFRTVFRLGHRLTTERPDDTSSLLLYALYKFRELYVEANYIPLTDKDGCPAVDAMNDTTVYFAHLKGLCVA